MYVVFITDRKRVSSLTTTQKSLELAHSIELKISLLMPSFMPPSQVDHSSSWLYVNLELS
jgi:hypothetical protein